MADIVTVNTILQGPEIYPENASYPFPAGVNTKEEKTQYWFNNSVQDFDNFYQQPNTSWSGVNWESTGGSGRSWSGCKTNRIAGTTYAAYWKNCHGHRITSWASSDVRKSGYKQVFPLITGVYEVQVSGGSAVKAQENRLKQILSTIEASEFGLIDPRTGNEAVIPLDSPNGRISYSYPRGFSDPSVLSYSVLEQGEAPLKMTDTLLGSAVKGLALSMYEENGEIPQQGLLFTTIMRMGKDSPLYEAMKHEMGGIPGLRTFIDELMVELTSMDKTKLDKLATTYEAEVPEYGEAGGVELVTKTIPLTQVLSLKFESSAVKQQLQKWRPPVSGMKRGSEWPIGSKDSWIIHLTQDPVEILCKSTNRSWSSCERLGNQYCKGAFDDFKVGNGVMLCYRAADVVDSEGVLRLKRSACRGRTMLRWGMGATKTEGEQPRIGVEGGVYGFGNSEYAKTRLNIGKALMTVFRRAGLWDWSGRIIAPYSYGGYADGGKVGGKLFYNPTIFGVTEGAVEGEVQRVLTYHQDYGMSYNDYRNAIDASEGDGDDAVILNVAQNPMIWNYDRVIGLIQRKIYGLYDEASKEALIRGLLSHEYANVQLLMPSLETLDIIQPTYASIGDLDTNLPTLFARHPRSNAQVHEKIQELMGEEWLNLYGMPCAPTLTPDNLPQYGNFIYGPESTWTPFMEKLKALHSKPK